MMVVMNDDKEWVLVVEDDEDVRDTMTAALSDEGYQVAAAPSGQEALDFIAQQRPCMIFLDLMMPGIDGWEVFRRLQSDATLADIPVCIMTAVPQKAPRGALSVLPKPVPLQSVLDLLSAYC